LKREAAPGRSPDAEAATADTGERCPAAASVEARPDDARKSTEEGAPLAPSQPFRGGIGLRAREQSLAADAKALCAQWVNGTAEQQALVVIHLGEVMRADYRRGMALLGALVVGLLQVERYEDALVDLRDRLADCYLVKEETEPQPGTPEHEAAALRDAVDGRL